MSDEFRVIGDPVFALSTSELLERDERTKVSTEKKLRPLARSVKDLDALHISAVVQTRDLLAWQVHYISDNLHVWSNAQDGTEFAIESKELFERNDGEPIQVLFTGVDFV